MVDPSNTVVSRGVESVMSALPKAESSARAPSDLSFDLKNPRLLGAASPTEADAIQDLVDEADIEELITSITHSGWLDFEPLIVLRDGNVVLEGNRRLAALRIIGDSKLQAKLNITVPTGIHENSLPDSVQVLLVDSRAEARDFIGFKHVNGPHKWDPLAKAKFAYDWLTDDPDTTLDDIARRLGDGFNTVARLVNGYTVLEQARAAGYDDDKRTSKRFAFSHLYTILTRPNARAFLGLTEPINDQLPSNPVPSDKSSNLLQLMTWLYGQGDDKSIIKSQNPNLNQLNEVLGNKTAVAALKSTGELRESFTIVEDKTKKFTDALFALQVAVREAAAAVGDYQFDPDIHEIALGIQKSVNRLVASMNSAKDETAKGDDGN